MFNSENAEKLNNVLAGASDFAAWAGEGNALSVPAIYIACLEAVTKKLAAQSAA